MCYDLGMYCKIWLHCISKYQKKKFYVPRQNALSKIMRFQELTIFAGKNISMGKYIFCTIYNFTVRQVTSALKKKIMKITAKLPSLHKYIKVLPYYNIDLRTSPVYVRTPARQALSHTSFHTNTPAFACLCTNTALTY